LTGVAEQGSVWGLAVSRASFSYSTSLLCLEGTLTQGMGFSKVQRRNFNRVYKIQVVPNSNPNKWKGGCEKSAGWSFLNGKCQYNPHPHLYGGWYRSPRNEKL
jgi:hypothetical protein